MSPLVGTHRIVQDRGQAYPECETAEKEKEMDVFESAWEDDESISRLLPSNSDGCLCWKHAPAPVLSQAVFTRHSHVRGWTGARHTLFCLRRVERHPDAQGWAAWTFIFSFSLSFPFVFLAFFAAPADCAPLVIRAAPWNPQGTTEVLLAKRLVTKNLPPAMKISYPQRSRSTIMRYSAKDNHCPTTSHKYGGT